jgi:hypothetical protein
MGEGNVERSKIRIVAIDRTPTSETDGLGETHAGLPLPEFSTARGKRKWEVSPHPSVRPRTILPSRPAQPQLARAVAVKDGPSSGHRLRRRAASLTAASTTAASCAVGAHGRPRAPIQPSESWHEGSSKSALMLSRAPWSDRKSLTQRRAGGPCGPTWASPAAEGRFVSFGF